MTAAVLVVGTERVPNVLRWSFHHRRPFPRHRLELLRRLVDIAIVGDQDPVPVADRSWAADAFGADTGSERVHAFAAVIRHVMASAGWAFRIAAQAAAADADAAALWATGQRHRLEDATRFVKSLRHARLLRRDRPNRDAVATVWLVSSPETFIQLIDGLDWTLGRYEHWVVNPWPTHSSNGPAPEAQRHRVPRACGTRETTSSN